MMITEVLNRLADDPNGWIDGQNRTIAYMIPALRNEGVGDAIIYRTIAHIHDEDAKLKALLSREGK